MHFIWVKFFKWGLDMCAALTIYLGFIKGSDLAIFFGMLASLAAFANHASQWYERYKQKKQKNKDQ